MKAQSVRYFLVILFLSTVLSAMPALSQATITHYLLTSFSGTYTSLSGTTGPYGDDNAMNISLPFPVVYDNVTYDQARICTNGWMELGSAARPLSLSASLSNEYLFTSTEPNKTLAPWWDDLGTGYGTIVYTTLGTAPHRTFAVEWQSVFSQIGSGRTLSFQIRIYEDSGTIEFWYGPASGTATGYEGASIGIEDATGGPGHFIDVPTGSSTTGTTNLSPATNWPTVFYRFINQGVCLQRPVGGEYFFIGTTDTIRWTSAGVQNVKLDYSTSSGNTWLPITPSTPASAGRYPWLVPNTPTKFALVRVTDAANSSDVVQSNAVFTIQALPAQTLTPASFAESVMEGDSISRTLTITNNGSGELIYACTALFDTIGSTRGPGGGYTFTTHEFPLAGPLPVPQNGLTPAGPAPTFGRKIYTRDDAGAEYPHILLYDQTYTSRGYCEQALANLGYSHTTVTTMDGLSAALSDGSKWDLVIVNSYAFFMPTSVLDRLDAAITAGTALMYADWAVTNNSNHALYTHMGVQFNSSITTPINFTAADANGMLFTIPNRVSHLQWSDDQANVDGQLVATLPGAQNLALYDGYSNGAIVLGGTYNTLFNAFQPVNFNIDADGDGKMDMLELIENEVVFMLKNHAWLTLAPTSGVIPAGSSTEIMVGLSGKTAGGGNYSAHINVRSNDPAHNNTDVPVQFHIVGRPIISLGRDSIGFGNAYVGFGRTDTLVVSNLGSEPLAVSAIVGSDSVFTVNRPTLTVAPHSSEVVLATFMPVDSIGYSGTFTIAGNDTVHPELNITLTGHGVYPPVISAVPESLSVSVPEFDSTSAVVTIHNSGIGDLAWKGHAVGVAFASQPVFRGIHKPAAMPSVKGWPAAAPSIAAHPMSSATASGARFNENFETGSLGTSWVTNPDHISTVTGSTAARGSRYSLEQTKVSSSGGFFDGVYAGFDPIQPEAISFWIRIGSGLNSGGTAGYVILGDDNITSNYGAFPFFATGDGRFQVYPSDGSFPYVPNRWYHIAYRNIDWTLKQFDYVVNDTLIRSGAAFYYPSNYISRIHLLNYTAGVQVWWDEINVGGREIDWLSMTPDSGRVAPGGSQELAIGASARSIEGGDYDASLVFENNDPSDTNLTVPVHLHVIGQPHISTLPESLHFGQRFYGFGGTDTLRILNTGSADLVVSGITSDQPEFSVDPASLTVGPHSTGNVAVTFTPADTGVYTGNLTITSNDTARPMVTVPLDAQSIYPPELTVSPDSISVTVNEGDSTTQAMTVGNTGRGELFWSADVVEHSDSPLLYKGPRRLPDGTPSPIMMPTPLTSGPAGIDRTPSPSHVNAAPLFRDNFESGTIGPLWSSGATHASAITSETAANWTHYSLTQTRTSGVGHLDGLWTDFTPVQAKGVSFWIRVGPGMNSGNEAAAYFVLGDSNIVGNAGAMFFMAQGDGHFVLYPADASFTYEINTWYHVEFRNIDWAAKTFDYYVNSMLVAGGLSFRATSTQAFSELHVYNFTSNVQAWWDEIAIGDIRTNWLSLHPDSGAVAPGQQQEVTAAINALQLDGGDYQADAAFASNDPAHSSTLRPVRLHVNGRPRLAFAPDSIDFGTAFTGYGKTESLYVANLGSAELAVSSLVSSLPMFSVDPSSFTVPAHSQVSVVVRFLPSDSGQFAATLTMATNDSNHLSVSIPVRGHALYPPVARLSPDSISMTLFTDEQKSSELVVGNSGRSTLTWELSVVDAGSQAQARTERPRMTGAPAVTDDPTAGHPSTVSTYLKKTVTIPEAVIGGGVSASFESGSLPAGWSASPAHNWSVTSATAANGTQRSLQMVRVSGSEHFDGITATFTPFQPENVSFWIRLGPDESLASGYFVLGDQNTTNTGGAFWFHGRYDHRFVLYPVDESFEYTDNTWYHIEFRNINWNTKYFDYYINGMPIVRGASFRDRTTSSISELHLYNYSLGVQAWWDEIKIGASFQNGITFTPPSGNLVLGGSQPVSMGFDGSKMPQGDFRGNIVLHSNDPANPSRSIPLDLHVLTQPQIVTGGGWNLLSIPFRAEDNSAAHIFPGAISPAFAYEGAYVQQDTLTPGKGFWLKFPTDSLLILEGETASLDTIPVRARWNLVGGPRTPVSIADITPAAPVTLMSAFYGYTEAGGYQVATVLQPTKGYWVKVSGEGSLLITGGTPAPKTVPSLLFSGPTSANVSRLTVTDAAGRTRELLYSVEDDAARRQLAASSEMPPPPPAGLFDVRFASNRGWETVDNSRPGRFPVLISGARYPLTIHWHSMGDNTVAALSVAGKEHLLQGEGRLKLDDPDAGVVLKLSTPAPLPSEFSLSQNYPNPFNPTTTIAFALPKDSYAHLVVYNLLGQVVATPVDGLQSAGYKTAEWNASGVASGLYFYRLDATPVSEPGKRFSEIRKMLLVK